MWFRQPSMTDRAIGRAKQVGDNLKFMVPSADTLLAAGAKLGAAKTGVRVAGLFLRRHPVATVATVAGAGLLWYAAKRRAARSEQGNVIVAGERRSRRIDASGDATTQGAAGSARGERDTGSRRTASSGSSARKRGGARGGSRNQQQDAPGATH